MQVEKATEPAVTVVTDTGTRSEGSSPTAAVQETGSVGNDRRDFLGTTALGLLSLMVARPLRAQQVSELDSIMVTPTTPPSYPAHLTSLDINDPNAFIPWAVTATGFLGGGDLNQLLLVFESFVQANADVLAGSAIVEVIAQRDAAGQTPQTIREMVEVFLEALSPSVGSANSTTSPDKGLLCVDIAGDGCTDVGCDAHCDSIPRFGNGGVCLPVPGPLQDVVGDTCMCMCNPPWWELALIALILLLLIATPGPDEIPAILAAISRYVVRVAPAIG